MGFTIPSRVTNKLFVVCLNYLGKRKKCVLKIKITVRGWFTTCWNTKVSLIKKDRVCKYHESVIKKQWRVNKPIELTSNCRSVWQGPRPHPGRIRGVSIEEHHYRGPDDEGNHVRWLPRFRLWSAMQPYRACGLWTVQLNQPLIST